MKTLPLRERIAIALGWELEDVNKFSLPALVPLVMLVNRELYVELIDVCSQGLVKERKE